MSSKEHTQDMGKFFESIDSILWLFNNSGHFLHRI